MPAKNLFRENEQGTYSHIYNKGVDKRIIFNDEEDYQVFQDFLKDYLTVPQNPESTKKDFTVNGRVFRGTPHQPKNYFNKVELIAYSLMPDHFHLLLYQKTRGSIESLIRSLCTRYSIYFNKKYQRTGSLFAGPYKSVQIRDEPALLQLTGYLHRTGSYSSYPEYLGTRITPWISPQAVLAFFGQGVDQYKYFVEKYEPNQEQKELLKEITFETETDHLERRKLIESIQNHPLEVPQVPDLPAEKLDKNPHLKPHHRLPEFLGVSVIFLLLIGIGITNIMASLKNSEHLTLGIATTLVSTTTSPQPSPTSLILKTDEIKIAPTRTVPTETEKPKTMVTVKVSGGTRSVNIRQKPTAKSTKIGKAKDGETFEFVSVNSGWYEVKLATGSIGFISEEYIKILKTNI